MAARALILPLIALLSASCLDPMDRELTECHPRCDDAAVPDTARMDAEERSDSGVHDADPMDASALDAEEPHLELLEAAEATPHQITWEWNPALVPAEVIAYRLRQAHAIDQIPAAAPWDQADDENLGHREVTGPGLVRRTRVLELEPGTTYYARLYGVRAGGDEVPLAQGMGTTALVPAGALILFDEELPIEARLEGFSNPDTAEQAYQGAAALWFESPPVVAAAAANLARPFPVGLGDRWANAYLEMFVLVTPERSIGFLEIMLSGFSEAAEPTYSYFALAPRAGWHRLEVPLSSYALVPGTEMIQAFGVRASSWGELGRVFVDAVAIRY